MVSAFALGFDDHERFGHEGPTGLGRWDRPSSVVGGATVGGAYRRRTVVRRSGRCQLRVVPEAARGGPSILRASCTCSRPFLALSLDPKEILDDLSPYGEIGLMLIIFAETGLLDRLLPPRRLAPLHRRDPRQPGQAEPRRHPRSAASSPPSSATRSASPSARRRVRASCGARTRGSSNRSTSTAPRTSSTSTAPKTIVLGAVRADRADVRAGRRRHRQDVAPDVPQLQRHRRLRLGVRRDAGRATAWPTSSATRSTSTCYPLIAAIIIISLIPPFLEWRKAKRQKPVHFTQAQAEAEAAALHEVVEED